ncbi:PST family polysaccharide transporter [Pseudorhizobium tarimense]|uniref:PST family polysaccharide transporter n=1 Tax=Pseudorhizobium tarimense TaxID=1079109 RepID=A0ABV2H5Q7_9HYPH|nr:O-antigen translocase [Pseudorhizobium tarimense]MCJ8519273.1 O-antigen translocase [Pseudorhizobium tarimense]
MTLLRTSTLSGLETILRLSTGLLVVKYLSVVEGPEAVALFGQFQNFVAAVGIAGGAALVTGLVALLAENAGSEERSATVCRHAFGVATVSSATFAILILIFARDVAQFVLGDTGFAWLMQILAIILLPISAYQLSSAILNGRQQIAAFVLNRAAYSMILLVVAIVLVAIQGVGGGLLGLAVAPALACLVGLTLLARQPGFSFRWCVPVVDRNGIREFLPYWLMSIMTAALTPLVLVIARTYIGKHIGWVEAGWWEAALRVSDICLVIVTTALATYYVPRLASARDLQDERRIMMTLISFAVLVSGGAALFIFVMRYPLIATLFSPEFYPAAELFGVQLITSIIKVATWVVAYHMIVRKRMAWIIGGEVLFSGLFLFLVAEMTNAFGIIGAVYAGLVNIILYVLYCSLYVWRNVLG